MPNDRRPQRASFVADFLRVNMRNVVRQFTIETMMSDPGKADFIRRQKQIRDTNLGFTDEKLRQEADLRLFFAARRLNIPLSCQKSHGLLRLTDIKQEC